jgi:hypothetical protein
MVRLTQAQQSILTSCESFHRAKCKVVAPATAQQPTVLFAETTNALGTILSNASNVDGT